MKTEFKKAGYLLLAKEYTNSKIKMKCLCLNHPEEPVFVAYQSIRRNSGCAICKGVKKHDIEFIRKKFEEKGYELLDDEYKGAHEKLHFRCPNHQDKKLKIDYHSLRKGSGCRYCYNDRQKETMKGNTYSGKGEESPSWKGGVSEVNDLLRKSLSDWKLKVMERHDYKCFFTGENDGTLIIHHKNPFHCIRDEVLSELSLGLRKRIGDYSSKELADILFLFEKRHSVSMGVVMKKNIHVLFHNLYGMNCSESDFIDFAKRVRDGEYEGSLKGGEKNNEKQKAI